MRRRRARSRDDQVAVAVTDTGEGIPAADLPRVFRKFFRRDHGKPTGTGLGLWISRGLVEAHGGRLTADLGARARARRSASPSRWSTSTRVLRGTASDS